MDQEYKLRLQKNYVDLTENITVEDFLSELFQEEIITIDDKEVIESKATSRHKASTMIDILLRRGPKGYKVFRGILAKQSVYKWLCGKLDMTDVAQNVHRRQRVRQPYTEVNNSCITAICNCADITKIRSIGRELGLSEPDMCNIEYANMRDLKEQVYQIFILWKERNGKAATVERIKEAFQNLQMKNVVDVLDGYA